MNRRTATDADLTEGTIVFKGNGLVEYRVWLVRKNTGDWVDAEGKPVPTRYGLQKITSKSRAASVLYRAEDLQIEEVVPFSEPGKGPFRWGRGIWSESRGSGIWDD